MPAGSAKKILIVEADALLGDELTRKLRVEGYTVLLVRDGAEGLKQMRGWRPDLILLDAAMSPMNGYAILEEKQKDRSILRIPAIILLDSGEPTEVNRALTLGVRDYLVKTPFDPEDMLAKVRVQLHRDETAEGPPPKKSTPTPAARVARLSGKKIMAVEDDEFLSDIIARKLSEEGCRLVHTRDGAVVLELFEKEKPDLILLDIILPGMDGFEILRQLRENVKTRDIPVILLTNLGQKSDIEKGMKLGAARFLVKATVTLDEIVDEIKAVLGAGTR